MKRPVVNTFLALSVLAGSFALSASAEERRIEYRYPDRPDLVFSADGVSRAVDPDRPMAFSNFQAAVSVADAQSVLGQRHDPYISELPRRAAPRPASSTLNSTAVVSAPATAPAMQPYRSQPVQPAAPSGVDFVIQAGAFSSYANADRLASQLRGYGEARIEEGSSNGRLVYRVMLGGWISREQAMPMLDLIKARGFDGFVTRTS